MAHSENVSIVLISPAMCSLSCSAACWITSGGAQNVMKNFSVCYSAGLAIGNRACSPLLRDRLRLQCARMAALIQCHCLRFYPL